MICWQGRLKREPTNMHQLQHAFHVWLNPYQVLRTLPKSRKLPTTLRGFLEREDLEPVIMESCVDFSGDSNASHVQKLASHVQQAFEVTA